jgi:hypothetical protein
MYYQGFCKSNCTPMYQPRNNKVHFLFIFSQLSYLLAFKDDTTRKPTPNGQTIPLQTTEHTAKWLRQRQRPHWPATSAPTTPTPNGRVIRVAMFIFPEFLSTRRYVLLVLLFVSLSDSIPGLFRVQLPCDMELTWEY